MIIPEFNQVSYGKKSLRISGPKLWNGLRYHIKSPENLESSKEQLTIGMEKAAVNKLMFRFNVEI